MPDLVYHTLENGIYTITMDHPKANALSLEMVRLLLAAFKEAARQNSTRVVLLRGAGSNFSAGQDVYEILEAQGESYRKHMLETYNPLVALIRQLDLPVLAEIHGTAAGAALGLALACDLRIASEDARLLVGFLGIGLALDSAVSLFLPQIIGVGRATEVIFSNQPINAPQALAWGLVNRVVPNDELHSCALQMVENLANGPIHSMGLAKRDLNKAVYPNLEAVLDYEAHIQEIARLGNEHREGLQAFIEKRTPDWKSC